jgi:hypothetical protein
VLSVHPTTSTSSGWSLAAGSGRFAVRAIRASLSRSSRWFWPRFFAHDGVWLQPEVLPALLASGPTLALQQSAAALPYLPLARAPWFLWIGRPRADAFLK